MIPNQGLIFNIQKFSLNDGPGIRTVVFFKGCPLRCQWCANPESQSGVPEQMYDESKQQSVTVGQYMTVPEIMAVILQDKDFYEESGGGVTFSGGEVLFQAAFATELAKAVQVAGIHLACETTGVAAPAVFNDLMQYMDLIFFDCKQWDTQLHKNGTGGGNHLILQNLKTALTYHCSLQVRTPIIPGFNDTENDAIHFGQLFNQLGVQSVELLPFHQFGLKKYADLHRNYELANVPQLQAEDLSDFQKILTQAGIQTKVNGW